MTEAHAVPATRTWTSVVEQDGGDYLITLPQELLDAMGWGPGDNLAWVIEVDGTVCLSDLIWGRAEEEPGFWNLHRKRELVGEVHPQGSGFRWHCKLSDVRRVEETEDGAKAALMASVRAESARTRAAPRGEGA